MFMRVHCLILLNHASSKFDEAMQLVDASTKHIFAVFRSTVFLLYSIKFSVVFAWYKKDSAVPTDSVVFAGY